MKNDGFSLVELIVVIAIMAILVGVAVPVYTGYIQNAKEAKDQQYLGELSHAAQVFAAENNLELQSILVAPVVEENKGVVLVLADGTNYVGDMSEFYAILGAYDFETINTSQTITYREDQGLPPAGGETECSNHQMELVQAATCYENGYSRCTNDGCGHVELLDKLEHDFYEETIGNMHITRCRKCTYFSYDFYGDSLSGK